ncbi:hypothetical protein LEP1GSC005_4046 [Leptospira santarosai str. ST188]|nr:hypothetical protein LEP1GSC005_4046 [Leptospira santarosai str. ST188]
MLLTLNSWNSCINQCLKLHRVQMTPRSFFCMIFTRTLFTTVRALYHFLLIVYDFDIYPLSRYI